VRKTVTVLGYDRPEYMRQCLQALANCRGVTNYEVVASIDGQGDALQVQCLGQKAIIQDRHLGIDHHNFAAYSYAFDVLGSDLNVCLEDDVVVCPDALELVDWYAEDCAKEYFSLSIGNAIRAWGPDPYGRVVEEDLASGFCTSAYCLPRRSWEAVRGEWSCRLNSQEGWDYSFSYAAWKNGWRRGLCPEVSRSRNIGRVGRHSTPEFFDANWAPAIWSDGRRTEKFEVFPQEFVDVPEWIKKELNR
jgi:GT2 family glycosyltransferase